MDVGMNLACRPQFANLFLKKQLINPSAIKRITWETYIFKKQDS